MTVLESQTQKAIRTFNLELLFTALAIFAIGLFTLYSGTQGPGTTELLMKKQIIAFGIGCTLASILVFIDSQVFERFTYPLYLICLGLLILVAVLGQVRGGARSWFSFGFYDFQPSEFTKIAAVFVFAKYFANLREEGPFHLRKLIFPAILLAPAVILISAQPDFGTAGIVFLTAGTMVLFLGVKWRSILIVALIGTITVPVGYFYMLKDYQRKRIITFLDPGSDPRKGGYNALQSKIAVGSGKILGKGYLKGTQAHLNFIPEQHTDFIFSVLAEEWGFAGSLLLLILYFLYCLFALRTAARARDKFQMLVCVGLTAMLFWHVFINVGMVIGVLPIVGVTLPFLSYGGTSLLTFIFSVALLLNLSRKKYIF